MTDEELAHRFTYHPPTAESIPKFGRIREVLLMAAIEINHLAPDGREKSIAMTKLEEARNWANAAIAREVQS